MQNMSQQSSPQSHPRCCPKSQGSTRRDLPVMLWPWALCLWWHCEEEGWFRRAMGWFCGCYWGAPPQRATWEKGAMYKWKDGLDLHGCGQDLSQQCQPFRGDKRCPRIVAGVRAGHQVVAAELWVGVGWTSCLDTPCGQVLRSCAWRSQH